LFQQDVLELQATKEKEEHAHKMSLIAKVDSRTDAERSDMLRADPTLAQQFEQERVARVEKRRPKVTLNAKALEKAEAAKAAKAAAASPAMPQQYPGMASPMMMPGMMPMQQSMYPPMMMPQHMMPQHFMQPVLMPQPTAPPMVGTPAWMPNAHPQAGYPPRSHAPPQPAPAYQAPAAPAPVQTSPSPAADPNQPVDPDTLEYMTELPDVM
jgi:hypothetical protein